MKRMKRAKKRYRQMNVSKSIKAVTPNRFTAQIDLDTKNDVKTFRKMVYILRARTNLYAQACFDMPRFISTRIHRSKGGHWHAKIVCDKPLSDITRIALQAVLGSDRKRELLSLCRYFAGSRYPTLFFEVYK
jgi:hypothetical protein